MDAIDIEAAYHGVCGDCMSAWEYKAVFVQVSNDMSQLLMAQKT